ncbi:hypothetical protein L798_15286 [Zootermopsis nevadensis]|uniref:RNA-directed DNA polymerase from mobile element jockey n=1 Tax=Zootermopsis nevadensis TaxID=136037 RepID=A0A067QMC1_ZOONE|nr:hypothetical protein L798_15286 [Zootermopsis nevadensis]
MLGKYLKKWRLIPSPSKTETTSFHHNNRMANRELKVYFNNILVQYNAYPKYLGVTLDRTLSFKKHLHNTAAKITTRNNILQKLCSTTWGSSASTLRISTLGLVFPTAEYCAQIWLNSPHVHKLDSQLNNTMRTVTGCLRTTPTHWLPILSRNLPPAICRQEALLLEFKKLQANPNLPVHDDIPHLNLERLRSR